MAELERQLQEARVEQILPPPDRLRPFEEAVRRLDDETRLLSTLRLTLRQREIDFQVPKRTIELLGEAEPARGTSKPNWSLNLALVCGLVLGVGGLLEYFDTSFRNVAEGESRLQVPVLGIMPFQQALADRGGCGGDDDPAAAEPFRVLHANLGLADPTGAKKVLVVVSAGPGEGRSTALHHLARATAAGEKVLLVDGDLRRPSQYQHAAVERAPGLGEVLTGRRDWTEVVRREFRPRLDLLTAGSGGGHLFGVVAARGLHELITAWRGGLRSHFNRIPCPLSA